MRPRVCIYTAVYGGYDDLKPQAAQSIPCDFVCFTDRADPAPPAPWRVVAADWDEVKGAPPRVRAKFPKLMAHAAFAALAAAEPAAASAPYDFTIWIDASIRLLRPSFAARMIDAASRAGIALVAHPERDCVYSEAAALDGPWTRHKVDVAAARAQVERYRAEGLPERHGLFAGGVIARDMRDAGVARLGEAWWAETRRWSVRDQLSLPFVLWRSRRRVEVVDLDLWRNPLFEVLPHFDAVSGALAMRGRAEHSLETAPAGGARDRVALFEPESAAWHFGGGETARRLAFGAAPSRMVPLLGDWDGGGADTPGLYDPATGTFFLRNELASGPADETFVFGRPGALAVSGDWDGDGVATVGLFHPATGTWSLTNRHESGAAAVELSFGAAGSRMLPLAGDWDGRGRDRVGLFDPATAAWFLLDELATGAPVTHFTFGPLGGLPVAGDWDADGADEVGVYVPEQGLAVLARENREASSGWRVVVDPPRGVPVAGRWE